MSSPLLHGIVCQNCQRQPATVTRRVRTKGKAMQDRHECIKCAEKRNIQRYGSKRKTTKAGIAGRKEQQHECT